eukprot:scaffold34747_cov148-Skeletonema_menzelii.AAC.2
MRRFLSGDNATVIEYLEKAAGLGHIESHYHLSSMYEEGRGVERNTKKLTYHLEQAAIGGHPISRYNLGIKEWRNGNRDKAAKHWIIAANLGLGVSIEMLKKCYQAGVVGNEDFAIALRAYQAAVDATKSPQRDAAEAFEKKYSGGRLRA